jgi:endonuclease/exonuclease/phosphatase (EEP) superfamily protein YafD
MLRAAASSALSLCIFAGAALTLAGALAPLVPEWEMINHFRPYIAAGFTAMLAFAFVLGSRTLMLTALAFNALNAALLLVPVTLQASTAPRSSAPRFKLITFNVYAGNHDFDVTARFLREADADIVVLQEVTHKHGDNLLPDLRDLYPYQLSCDRTIRCGLAILSKTPWTEADFSAGDRDRPPLIWARYGTDAEGYRVAGTQFGTPLRPAYQVRNGRWLAE